MGEAIYSQLISIYDSAPDGLIIVKDGTIQHANNTLYSLLGVDITELKLEDVFSHELMGKINQALMESTSILLARERVFDHEFSVRVTRTANGYIIVLGRLQASHQEEERRQEQIRAIETFRQRLGSPITNILSSLELCEKRLPADVPEKVRQYMALINKNTHEILQISISLSELIQGALPSFDKGCRSDDIAEFVYNLVEQVGDRFSRKGIMLDLEKDYEPIPFVFNRNSIRHAILRLLAHELRYTKAGNLVRIRVKRGERMVVITASDDGPGLPDGYLTFLYGNRVDDLDRDIKEYGSELYLVKRVVERYDGRVLIECSNQGTSISISLPENQIESYVEERRGVYSGLSPIKVEMSELLPLEDYFVGRDRDE